VGVVFENLGGEVDGRIEGIVAGVSRLVMGTPPNKRIGVFVCHIPLGVEQFWQGGFLFLACNFSWMHYMQGRKTAKGSKNRIENGLHHHHLLGVQVFSKHQALSLSIVPPN
jgi:hypothetical protein